MRTKNALGDAPDNIDEKFNAAKRRNNALREVPVESHRPQGWKFKVRPTGGIKNLTDGPQGFKISGKLEF